jgi:hypothetical protein
MTSNSSLAGKRVIEGRVRYFRNPDKIMEYFLYPSAEINALEIVSTVISQGPAIVGFSIYAFLSRRIENVSKNHDK